MIVFRGQHLAGWRVWGFWYKQKYFVGFSIVQPNNIKKGK